MKNLLFLILITFSFFGCKSYSEEEKQSFDKDIKAYLKKTGIKCNRSASGLYYKIIQPGEGEFIKFQDVVSFTYTGEFLNGERFDHQKEPVEFAVKELIPGWKEILLELKPGAQVFLVIPPHLGYGTHELDDIPPNSILVYEMEILAVK